MKVELPLGRALRILHKKAFEIICNANEPQRLWIKKDKKKATRSSRQKDSSSLKVRRDWIFGGWGFDLRNCP